METNPFFVNSVFLGELPNRLTNQFAVIEQLESIFVNSLEQSEVWIQTILICCRSDDAAAPIILFSNLLLKASDQLTIVQSANFTTVKYNGRFLLENIFLTL